MKELIGTSACPDCGSWGSVRHYRMSAGDITEQDCPTCRAKVRVTDRDWGDVTDEDASTIARINPYYAQVDGRPLPVVMLEEGAAGQVAREWFARWRDASTKEQIEFCGAMLFWSPK